MHAWAMSDRLFHESIIQLSGNPFLINAYGAIGTKIAALVYRLPATPKRIAHSLAQHRCVLSMTCRQRFDVASRLLMENIHAVAILLGSKDTDSSDAASYEESSASQEFCALDLNEASESKELCFGTGIVCTPYTSEADELIKNVSGV